MPNKKLQAIIKDLFIRGRKFNISLVFITQSYFRALKNCKIVPKLETVQVVLVH